MTSGADAQTIERLARLGDVIGTAFQVSDDIIDIASPTDDSGKTPGTDLREGVHTCRCCTRSLPTVPMPQSCATSSSTRRRANRGPARRRRGGARTGVVAHPDGMAARATSWVSTCRGARGPRPLPASPARDALADLAAYTVERTG